MLHEFVPPWPWEIFLFSFWLLQHNFSWKCTCTAMYSCHFQGKRKLWAAVPCSKLSSSSSWLPHPTSCHPLCPWLDTLSLSWVPQPPPSPNHGQQGETEPTQETPVSHRARVPCTTRALPAACATEEASASWAALCMFIFTTLANQKQGIQKYTLYMMACIWHCLLSVKIPN